MSSSWKMQSSCRVLVLLVLLCLSTVCSGLSVKNLSVPQSYVLDHNTPGAPKPLVLDCEYETDARDTGIVLKWFFNNFPIYQWIPNSHPIPLQKFKPHLDTTYTVNQDPKQMYRAISIVNPSWNMTGNYTCSLQSFSNADQRSAQLIVIEPEKEFDLEVDGSHETNLVVACRVAGIYPKPFLSIEVDGVREYGTVTDNESVRPTNGLYEVNVKASVNKTLVKAPATIRCLLEIPATDYVRERTETYNEATTTTAQTLTYRDGESDETNQISRLEAVVGSHERRDEDGNGVAVSTVLSTAVLVLSTMFLRYTA